jgi:hypothetical protein
MVPVVARGAMPHPRSHAGPGVAADYGLPGQEPVKSLAR